MQRFVRYSLLSTALVLGLQGCSTIREHVCEKDAAPAQAKPAKATNSNSVAAKTQATAAASESKSASPKIEVQNKPATAPAPIKANVAPQPEAKPVAAAKAEAKPAATGKSEAKPVPKKESNAAAAPTSAPTREQVLALAGKSNCLVCHKVDSKLVGPAWKDVGAKYKNDANAAATIAANIKKGGSFGWKIGSMPPKGAGQASDADIATLAAFIAGLK